MINKYEIIKGIPTEPIGSVPRTAELQKAMSLYSEGRITSDELNTYIDQAVRETIKEYEDVLLIKHQMLL